MSSLGGFREPYRDSFPWGATAIVAFLLVLMFWLLPGAIDRKETAECVKWQGWAAEYPAFYLTPDEADQCTAHNITISAPVKR